MEVMRDDDNEWFLGDVAVNEVCDDFGHRRTLLDFGALPDTGRLTAMKTVFSCEAFDWIQLESRDTRRDDDWLNGTDT